MALPKFSWVCGLMTITLKRAQGLVGKMVLARFNDIVFYAVVTKIELWRIEYRVWFGVEKYRWRIQRDGAWVLLGTDDFDSAEGFVRLKELTMLEAVDEMDAPRLLGLVL